MRAKIAALLFMLSIVTLVHARGPYGSISAAGWSGGAFTDDQTGEFSNCIASASYKSGIIFGVVVSKTLNWLLATRRIECRLPQGGIHLDHTVK